MEQLSFFLVRHPHRKVLSLSPSLLFLTQNIPSPPLFSRNGSVVCSVNHNKHPSRLALHPKPSLLSPYIPTPRPTSENLHRLLKFVGNGRRKRAIRNFTRLFFDLYGSDRGGARYCQTNSGFLVAYASSMAKRKRGVLCFVSPPLLRHMRTIFWTVLIAAGKFDAVFPWDTTGQLLPA